MTPSTLAFWERCFASALPSQLALVDTKDSRYDDTDAIAWAAQIADVCVAEREKRLGKPRADANMTDDERRSAGLAWLESYNKFCERQKQAGHSNRCGVTADGRVVCVIGCREQQKQGGGDGDE